jgi:predicted RNA-binding Zn-ribbon protein involved in translation (DUF1610 family)
MNFYRSERKLAKVRYCIRCGASITNEHADHCPSCGAVIY